MTGARTTLREILRYPAMLVWSLYLLSIPFYFSKSGLPQPSNVILVLLVPFTIQGWDRRLDPNEMKAFRAMLRFLVWVTIVNYGWALLNWKWGIQDYILYPLYYLFNVTIFLIFLVLHRRFGDLLLRTTVYAVMAAVGIQIVASVVNVGTSSRSALFFNNPNQLGYYALLAGSVIALLQRQTKISRTLTGAALVACAYLAVLSASRAATLGIGLLFALLVFSNPKLIIAGMLLAAATLFVGGPVSDAIDRAQARAETRRNEMFAKERGYNRLWDFKEHLLLGAGEGEFERFTDTGRSREIHSSAATIVFSYGIVGALLFLSFAWQVTRRAGPRLFLMLVPTIAYTVAHQGLRFTMLWVMLALFMAVKRRGT